MLTGTLDYVTVLKIYFYILITALFVLFIETLIWHFKYKGEHVSTDARIKIDFDRDIYYLLINGKYIEGYLDMYCKNRYKFFEKSSLIYSKNSVLEQGTYKIKKKDDRLVFEFYTDKQRENN